MIKRSSLFHNFIKLLNPQPAIDGLAIGDVAIHFISLAEGKFKRVSVSLEPGVIEDGKLSDKEKFLKALLRLRQELGAPKDKIYVIVSIPPHNIYTQAFSLPLIGKEKQFQEAVALNLQLISPIDIKTAYYDWEKISEFQKDEKTELLGAFINKSAVDDFISVLNRAEFIAIAVEFSGLSIVRMIKDIGAGIDFAKPQLVLSVSSEGLSFMALKEGLHFYYFVPWNFIKSRQISSSLFYDTLIQETRKVFTFYSTHWNIQINDLILITPSLYEEIKKVLQENFSALNIGPLNLAGDFSNWGSSWHQALGAALRGRISRSRDTLISLMTVGTEEKFFEDQIIMFIKIWRNVFLAVISFLAIIFLFSDSLLAKISNNLSKQIAVLVGRANSQEITMLRQKAQEFNQLANKASAAKSQSNNISSFFEKIKNLGGGNVSFVRISLSANKSAVVTATAPTELAAINFKNKLEEQKEFQNIVLPLSAITQTPGGGVNFTLTFDLAL